MFDLVILSADKDQESALKGLLDSPQKLGIHPIHYKTITHPHRDPGCLRQSHDLLRPFLTSARYSLVVLDVEGSGSGQSQRAGVEAEVEQLLSQNGWNERVRCIAISPELEAWIWSRSANLPSILGWTEPVPLYDWLESEGHLAAGQSKPTDPKAALKSVLKKARRPASSSIFGEVARKVSYASCQDEAFKKLLITLRGWFTHSP